MDVIIFLMIKRHNAVFKKVKHLLSITKDAENSEFFHEFHYLFFVIQHIYLPPTKLRILFLVSTNKNSLNCF